jgi:hypothetical protein
VLEEDTNTPDSDTKSESETFFTLAGQMSSTYAKDIATNLNNCTFEHSLSAYQLEPSQSDTLSLKAESQSFVASKQKHYSPSQFYGLMINTGASQRSTVGYNQYLAYITTITANALIDKTSKGDINIKFSIRSISSISLIVIHSPVSTIKFYII